LFCYNPETVTEQYQIRGGGTAAIVASIEAGVREGGLAAGAALPPVRALATELGVAPGTVAGAYRILRQRGVIETAGRNGTRVRPRPAVATARPGRRLDVPPGALDLAGGGPDPRLLPALGPALRRFAAAAPVGYADGPLPDLLAAARRRLEPDGVPADALTVTSGALDAIERVLGAYLHPGDSVAVEDPGWANLLDLVAAMGLKPVPVGMDEEGPLPGPLRRALAAGVRAVVVTGRAHNPTGAALTASRAAAVRAALAEHPDVLAIEDDHSAELSGTPAHPVADAGGRWAYVRSVSKPYGPDLRLALCAGDAGTVGRVAGRARLGPGWPSTLLQRLVLDLWNDPAAGGAVSRARAAYARRREALLAALAARDVPARGRTGINVWVPVPDETVAVAALRDRGYVVAPGALYRIASPSAVRVTVSALDPERAGPLADAVAEAVRGPVRRAGDAAGRRYV
jgi:DNA-binding transcriptional MocR family regulator